MPNRLADSLSPYLLQHKDNPVDWYPWGEEAFEKARAEGKPVFLSIGYSSCHWCHVMAHESFEDDAVARALSSDFVSIKVDREERPDVDDAYMIAAQLATGHGGWPLSAFLTPDRKPFFAGTYFSKEQKGQVPGFLNIVQSLAQAWRSDRESIEETADKFADAIAQALSQPAGSTGEELNVDFLDATIEGYHESFDFENGGFGGAPKFPPHTTLRYLQEYSRLRPSMGGDDTVARALVDQAQHMADFTLERMAMGGLHDVVAGGFHRYSTDERWHLPHFEKMLYDNGLLLDVYPEGHQAAIGIETWLREDLSREDGTLASARDADSDGEEGKFYVWTAEELRDVLGDDYEQFAAAYQISEEGNFLDEATKKRTGDNVLHAKHEVSPMPEALDKLFQRRAGRTEPALDDKAVACWNALAIAARPSTDWARACLGAWKTYRAQNGRLPHVVTRGVSGGLGYADDYFAMALAAHRVGDDNFANELLDEASELFADPKSGGFFIVSHEHEQLFGRQKPGLDTPVPSANGLAAQAFVALERWDEAERTLLANLGWMQRATGSAGALLLPALQFLAQGRIAATASGPPPGVKVSIASRELAVDGDGWAHTELVIEIPDGLHINTNDPPARWLEPTALKVDGVLGEAAFPESDDDAYRGSVRIPVRLKATKPPQEFEMTIRYQACTDSECLPPEEVRLDGVVLPRE